MEKAVEEEVVKEVPAVVQNRLRAGNKLRESSNLKRIRVRRLYNVHQVALASVVK